MLGWRIGAAPPSTLSAKKGQRYVAPYDAPDGERDPKTITSQSNTVKNPRKTTRRRAPAQPSDPFRDGDWHTPRSSQTSGQHRLAWELATRFRGKLIHVARIGWHEWAGSHWRYLDEKMAVGYVVRLITELLERAIKLDPAERDQWLSDIRKCEQHTGMVGVCKIAASLPGIAVGSDDVDSRSDLVAFTNGTYELATDTFRPAAPEDFITKVMGCAYVEDAECPTYDAMLADAQPDPEIRAYLHRQIGSALEGRTRIHMFPVWSGPGGAGKGSTLNDSWLPTFGEYGLAFPVEVLLYNGKGQEYMTERLSLKGARLVVTSEPKQGARFNNGLAKLMAGGDKLSARPLYENKMVTWSPTHQLFMMCNFRPAPAADDSGMWRRLKPVHWGNAVPEEKQDPDMAENLGGELEGIAQRILAGWRDFREHGLQVPESCLRDVKEWRDEVDMLGQFLEDYTEPAPDSEVRSNALFLKWSSWCDDHGEHPGSNKEFTMAMKLKGFKTKRSNGIKFLGLKLSDNAWKAKIDD